MCLRLWDTPTTPGQQDWDGGLRLDAIEREPHHHGKEYARVLHRIGHIRGLLAAAVMVGVSDKILVSIMPLRPLLPHIPASCEVVVDPHGDAFVTGSGRAFQYFAVYWAAADIVRLCIVLTR